MRTAYSALLTLLVTSAVPSVGFAQIVIPERPHYDARLERAVPVATVSLVGDIVELADARVVKDSSGEPFMLGSAKLDLRDPAHAKVFFTMKNATDTPIQLRDVELKEIEVATRPDADRVAVACSIGSQADHWGQKELQPGATITVQMPIAPKCDKLGETQAFLVFVGRSLPHPDLSAPDDPGWREVGDRYAALFRRAYASLRSQAPQ